MHPTCQHTRSTQFLKPKTHGALFEMCARAFALRRNQSEETGVVMADLERLLQHPYKVIMLFFCWARRNRSEETGVEPAYLERLHQHHEDWLGPEILRSTAELQQASGPAPDSQPGRQPGRQREMEMVRQAGRQAAAQASEQAEGPARGQRPAPAGVSGGMRSCLPDCGIGRDTGSAASSLPCRPGAAPTQAAKRSPTCPCATCRGGSGRAGGGCRRCRRPSARATAAGCALCRWSETCPAASGTRCAIKVFCFEDVF